MLRGSNTKERSGPVGPQDTAISKGTLGWRRRLGNVKINILYDLMSHTGSLDL